MDVNDPRNMILDHWDVGWVNISLRAPEKGPNKAKNGVSTMKKNFQWPERFYSVDWDEKWVSMQKMRKFDSKTAELALAGSGYAKCLLLPSELFRAVFFRRLPFKSFDTLHVNMLLREHVPKKDLEALRASRSFFELPTVKAVEGCEQVDQWTSWVWGLREHEYGPSHWSCSSTYSLLKNGSCELFWVGYRWPWMSQAQAW